MQPTTTATYRVLDSPRDPEEWLFLDTESADPTYVADDALPDGADLAPGNRVRATVEWVDEEPRVTDLDVERGTRVRFARTDEKLFEAAVECWEGREGPMASRVTYDNDRDAAGVVYTFAEQSGQRDLFGEFRDGEKPLEPLLERAAEGQDPPFSVFVLDPLAHEFVVVYIVFAPDSVLARTVEDEYVSG